MPASTQAIVLAAGKSSRFNTSLTKLSYKICGREMIRYPLNLLAELNFDTTVVVGHQQEILRKIIADNEYKVTCVEQAMQKGTGHALLCTRSQWISDQLLILNGDTPLITKEHIETLLEKHRVSGATISFMTSFNEDSTIIGYGRVIKKATGLSIVEHRDFTGDPKKECILNAGIYLIERAFLEQQLPFLATHASGEIFITDLIEKASHLGHHVEMVDIPFEYVRGINTLKELSTAEKFVTSQIISRWMEKGVRFLAPESVLIDHDVILGPNSTIGYGVQLSEGTHLGTGVTIEGFSRIVRSVIHDLSSVYSHSVISDSILHTGVHIGPFAHVHRNSICHEKSIIGNFVELSKSSVGAHSKAKHLTYLGQAHIGRSVNIGAGTITCNYDGVNKNETCIKDNAFVGSNCSLIAPLTIGSDAIIGAGSTVTEDVPDGALAIARQRQVNKEHYSVKIRAAKASKIVQAT